MVKTGLVFTKIKTRDPVTTISGLYEYARIAWLFYGISWPGVEQLTTSVPLSAGSEVSIQSYGDVDHSIPRVLQSVCLTVN